MKRDDKLLTTRQLADYLGITQENLRRFISSGKYKIPRVRVGTGWRYRWQDVDAWYESRAKGGPSHDVSDPI